MTARVGDLQVEGQGLALRPRDDDRKREAEESDLGGRADSDAHCEVHLCATTGIQPRRVGAWVRGRVGAWVRGRVGV